MTGSFKALVILLLAGGLLLNGCSGDPQPPLLASDIEVTAAIPGRSMQAAYLSLTNNTGETLTIDRIRSPQFESVEIHESTLENGVAKMRRLEELSIPANSTLRLVRGGKHLMLMKPTGPSLQVDLSLMNGDTVLIGVSTRVTPRNK